MTGTLRTIHGWIGIAIGLVLLPAALGAAPLPAGAVKDTTKRSARRDGWPESRPGGIARRWVASFSKGEDAMRACLTETLAPASLESKGIAQRLASYCELRERLGSLTLASVDKSTPGELRATLLASDLTRHQFVFTVQTEPPYKLVSVGRMEHRTGHGGFRH